MNLHFQAPHLRRIKRATTFEDLLDAVATRDIGSFYFLVQDGEGWILAWVEVLRVDRLRGMFDSVAFAKGTHSKTTLWCQAFYDMNRYESIKFWISHWTFHKFQMLLVISVSKKLSYTNSSFETCYTGTNIFVCFEKNICSPRLLSSVYIYLIFENYLQHILHAHYYLPMVWNKNINSPSTFTFSCNCIVTNPSMPTTRPWSTRKSTGMAWCCLDRTDGTTGLSLWGGGIWVDGGGGPTRKTVKVGFTWMPWNMGKIFDALLNG